MAELSALGDKFEAWAQEPPLSTPSTRPPMGGRPPVGVRGGPKGAGKGTGIAGGSARASSHVKRLGLHERGSSAPRMTGEDGSEMVTPEQEKIAEIKDEME